MGGGVDGTGVLDVVGSSKSSDDGRGVTRAFADVGGKVRLVFVVVDDDVTKPPLRTSRTALRRPIRFLLRRPNRRQDRRSLRRSFPENLITCIIACIPHMTHHVQSSRDL